MAESLTAPTTDIRTRWPFYPAPWIVLGLCLLAWISTGERLVDRALTSAERGEASPRVERVVGACLDFLGRRQELRMAYGKPLPLPVSYLRHAWESTWRPRARSVLMLGGGWLCLIANLLPAIRRRGGGDQEATRRTRTAIAVVLGAAALLIMLLLAVPMATRNIYTGDDLFALQLPMRKFVADSWARGDRASWCPLLNCGYDLHGEGQAGLDHPWHRLLYQALPLDLGFNLEMLAGFAFTWAGTTLLLMRWGLGLGPSLFGAFTFTFGTLFRRYFHLNVVGAFSHVPWLILCIEVLAGATDRRTIVAARAAIALLTASELLLGHPQFIWMSWFAEGLYLVVSLASGGRRIGLVTDYVIGKTVGVFLGASQWLPTMDLVSESRRASRDPEGFLRFAADGSLHPLNLLGIACPFALTNRGYLPGVVSEAAPSFYCWPRPANEGIGVNFQEFGYYAGLTPLILVLGLLACRPGPLRPRTPGGRALAFGGLLIVLGTVLSLGRFSPLLPLLLKIPVVNLFRCPARYGVLMTFGMAIVSACALARLMRPGDGRRGDLRWILPPAAVLLAANGFALALKAGLVPDPRGILDIHLPRWPVAALNPLLALAFLGLFAAALRGSRRALLVLVAAHVIDLSSYGLTNFWKLEPDTRTIAELTDADAIPADWYRGRIWADIFETDEPNSYSLYGLQVANVYLGLETRDELDYRRPDALRAAGVRWELPSRVIAEAKPIAGAVAEVRLIPRVRQSDAPRRDLAEIDLETTTLVDVPVNLGDPTNAVAGEARLVSKSNAEYRVKTRADSAQLLVVSTRYHRGWKAEIDGSPATVVRTNGDFIGCVVPAGEHEIRLAWAPASHAAGRAISAVGLVLLALSFARAGAVLPRRRRRAEAGESPTTSAGQGGSSDGPASTERPRPVLAIGDDPRTPRGAAAMGIPSPPEKA